MVPLNIIPGALMSLYAIHLRALVRTAERQTLAKLQQGRKENSSEHLLFIATETKSV